MNKITIRIAGRTVAVNAMYESTCKFLSGYQWEGHAEFSVEISPEDIALEREKAARENEIEGLPARSYTDAYLETTAVQRKIMEGLFEYDALLFHGSVVAVDGEAYLFTAKSGTGKSTHTRLWREVFGERAVMVNDDKPILRFDDGAVQACGTPWNGKHHLGENICCPLKAICVLERGEENRIRKITPREALLMLVQQSNRPQNPKLMPKYMELIDTMSQRVDFYRLECNIESEAALVAYRVMSGKEENK